MLLSPNLPATGRRSSIVILCFLATAYFFSASGRVGGADAHMMLRVTRSILAGTTAVDDPHLLAGPDGNHYVHFGLLTSLWWLPFVLLGRGMALLFPQFGQSTWEEFTVSFSGVPVALALLLYLRWVWRKQGLDEQRIATGLLVVGLCTMVCSYAKILSSDLLMALTLFAAWAHARYGCDTKSCLLAGLWLGLALLTRKQAQIIVPLLGLGVMMHMFRSGRSRDVAYLLAGGLPPLLLFCWYNWIRWGNPLLDPYPAFERHAPESVTAWFGGFYNILFGDYSGFFLFNLPLLVLLVAGVRGWYQRCRLEMLTVMSVFLSQLCFFVYMGPTLGPISFGARLMLLCVPFLALAWGNWPERPSNWAKTLLISTCVFGFSVQLLGLAIDPLAAWQRREAEQRPDMPILAAHVAELRRTLGLGGPSSPETGEENHSLYQHPAFQEPDFWWVHMIRRAPPETSAP